MPVSYMHQTVHSNPYHSKRNTVAHQQSEPPKKFITIDGVTQLNPAYRAYQQSQGKAPTTLLNPENALVVVSSLEDFEVLKHENRNGDIQLAPSTEAVMEMCQDPEVYQKVGLAPEAMMDGLGRICSAYEIPIGLTNKLFLLSELNGMEFIIDDSGSMSQLSNTVDDLGRRQTRWQEVRSRIYEMLKILAYVPVPPIKIAFFNRRDVVTLKRQGETPEIFLQNAIKQLDQIFAIGPSGGTPVRRRIEESIMNNIGKKIGRWVFFDGEGDGGEIDNKAICDLISKRPNPQGNPFTFLSCTGDSSQVRWAKELEERAPFCAENDDFNDERLEIQHDQGIVFPYTKGIHLISQLVAALDPDGLDALDESVPLTKSTLENLLGVKLSEQDYHRYFVEFQNAQRRRRIEDDSDQVKSLQNWQPFYLEFVNTATAKEIPAVKDFKDKLNGKKCPCDLSKLFGY